MNKKEVRQFDHRGTMISFRSDIKILDCTIRDGGLVNKFDFDYDFVRALYDCNVAAGVDYMELGYKANKKINTQDSFGVWKYTTEDDVRRITDGNDSNLKLSVMADAGRTDYHNDILPKEQSGLDMIRVACYVNQIPTALDMIKDAKDKGYEVAVNLMSISTVFSIDLFESLNILAESEADVVYLVDSFGALYPEQIRMFTQMYLDKYEERGKAVGIHAHNNQQLAFANTVESLTVGASYLDATYAGMGRGAGNCPMELLLGFLKNPKYTIFPLLDFIPKYMEPLAQKGYHWGCALPYIISGQLNIHPGSAIDFLSGGTSNNYTEFYDKLKSGL